MFLDRIAELGLLQHDSESDIMGGFPLDVKCVMISQMNRYLLSSKTEYEPAEVLTSPAHIKFTMEIVGQGFDLPLHNLAIITQSIAVYSSWLMEPKKRPLSMIELEETSPEFQSWIQNIFTHISLLFRPRLLTEGKVKESSQEEYLVLFNQHIELCEKALDQYFLHAISLLSPTFTEETWCVLLKVLLGICDTLLTNSFLRAENSTSNATVLKGTFMDKEQITSLMGDRLCETLIKTIFKVYAASQTTRHDLWDIFKEHFMVWNYRVQMIREWCDVSLALSEVVIKSMIIKTPSIRSLALPASAEIGAGIRLKETRWDMVGLENGNEQHIVGYYCWHRILYIMQNPIYLEPINFQTAVAGISRLVKTFLNFGRKIPDKDAMQESPINGNTILNMFGEWLFPAAAMFKSGYETGRADAISCLCRIFSQRQMMEPFKDVYLEKFYQVLEKGLAGDFLPLCSVIHNSSKLFSLDLDGFRILTAAYIKGLSRILPAVQMSPDDINLLQGLKMDIDNLRTDAYRILGFTVIGINLFANTPISCSVHDINIIRYIEPSIQCWIDQMYPIHGDAGETLGSLKPLVIAMLLNSVIIEAHQANTKLLLNLISCFCAQEAKHNEMIYAIFIKVVQEMVVVPEHWVQDVILAAFDLLNFFAAVINPEIEATGQCAKDLSLILCMFINSHLKAENFVALQQRIIKGYELLSKWVLVGNWLASDIGSQKIVISCISRGVVFLERDDSYSHIGEPPTPPKQTVLSQTTIAALGKLSESFKLDKEIHPPPAITQSSTSFVNINTIRTQKKTPLALVPPTKRFAKLRLSYSPSGGNLISTASKDNPASVPTFAVISAEIHIKTAAERAMQLVCLEMGEPMRFSCFGVARLHSGWKELSKAAELSRIQLRLSSNADARFLFPEEHKFVRYFAFQKNIIFGMIELPLWSRADTLSQTQRASLAVITINSEGKFSWAAGLEYSENGGDSDDGVAGSFDAINSMIDHRGVFQEWRNILQQKYVVAQTNPVFVSEVKTATSYNESNVPGLDECTNLFDKDLEWTEIKENIVLHHQMDTEASLSNTTNPTRNHVCKPKTNNSKTEPDHIPKSFRLFLSTLGMVDYHVRGLITAMPLTNTLVADLEKLDDIPPRDIFTIDVFYYRLVQDVPVDAARAGEMVCKDFEGFLWTLGWPVDLATHAGHKGNLGDTYLVAPYYANKAMEVVFRVPYLEKKASNKKNLHARSVSSVDSGASSLNGNVNANSNTNLSSHEEGYSNSNSNGRKRRSGSQVKEKQQEVPVIPDTTAIIWLETLYNITRLLDLLPLYTIACIVVHPIDNSGGLFRIRIMGREVGESWLNVGPLMDEMIIGRDSIGDLTRNTAANITKSYQISKNTYKKPHLARRQLIEDICSRHSDSNNGLYNDLIRQR